MSVGALLDDVRETYVSRLRDAATRFPGAILEPVLRDSDDRVVREGKLQLGLRVDIVRRTKDGICSETVDSDALPRFEPVTFEWDGATIELRPFYWDALTLQMDAVVADADLAPLRVWFERWFRANDDDAREGPLLGVAHFMSDPRTGSDACLVDIDLGSAPVEALEELFDAAVALGARRVVVVRSMG